MFDLFAGFKVCYAVDLTTVNQLIDLMHRILCSFLQFYTPTENMFLNRIIFLESVAAIPGMVGGTLRHLKSLRNMQRDHGE